MSDEFLSRCYLELDGQDIADFDSFTEGAIERGKEVKLMNKTGYTPTTARYSMTVGYVVPATGEVDWSTVIDARLTAVYENGKRKTYTGVRILEEGEEKADGENAIRRDIKLGAKDRIIE